MLSQNDKNMLAMMNLHDSDNIHRFNQLIKELGSKTLQNFILKIIIEEKKVTQEKLRYLGYFMEQIPWDGDPIVKEQIDTVILGPKKEED